MIKFFRNIRKNLLNEGKTSRYLKYAIGEIILVMIGILLALQVNNWNNSRTDDKTRKELIKNLYTEFMINKNELEGRLNSNDKGMMHIKKVLGMMTPKYDTLDVKLLDSLMVHVLSIQTYDGSSGVLMDMIGNNKLGLITNDSLRIALASWTQKVDNVQERESRVMKLNRDYLNPYLYKHYSYMHIDESTGEDNMPISKLPFDNRNVMANVEFETILNDYYWQKFYLRLNYKGMERELHRILRFIEAEQKQ